MEVSALLHPLREEPRDSYAWTDGEAPFDRAVYRLGLRMLPTPGFPDVLDIGHVKARAVRGPVLTQRTELRQRHGFPLTFDKHMSRENVGDGELILILSIDQGIANTRDVEDLILVWRSEAEAAAGFLAAVLDERVAGERLLEDVVLLSGDEKVVGAADIRERVRTYLPFEVTALDSPALVSLGKVQIRDRARAARASRLLRRAALEGPTADAYVMLFLAAESVLDSRQPSKQELDAILSEAGLDPLALPVRTRSLIRLRGRIVHEGLDDHPSLRAAYYEMEAIVRLLIRRVAGLPGGWWPTPGPAAYADGWAERVDAAAPPTTSWHKSGLPPVSSPAASRIPRRVMTSAQPLVVELVGFTERHVGEEVASIVSSVIADAHAWVNPDGPPVVVTLNWPAGPEPDVIVISSERIYLPAARLDGTTDPTRPEQLVNLVWDLHGAVGGMAVMRQGIVSEGEGIAVIEASGAFHQYCRLVDNGEFDAMLLNLPTSPTTMLDLGKLAGWAAAGDRRAAATLSELDGKQRELTEKLVALLSEVPPFPLRPLVES